MLAPAILLLMVLTIVGCTLLGILGASLRQKSLIALAALLPAIIGLLSLWSNEPLIRVMVPYAGAGMIFATVIGGLIRFGVERKALP